MKSICALALFVIAAAAIPAAAEIVVTSTLPVTLRVDPATCPLAPPAAGVITGSGVSTFFMTVTNTPSGSTHVGVHFRAHGKAVDETGENWTWSDADLFQPGVVNSSGDSFVQTIVEGFHLIGKNGQKIMIQGVFHIRVIDGVPVVEFAKGNETEENEPCEGIFF